MHVCWTTTSIHRVLHLFETHKTGTGSRRGEKRGVIALSMAVTKTDGKTLVLKQIKWPRHRGNVSVVHVDDTPLLAVVTPKKRKAAKY